MARKIVVRERFVVIPADQGFYALRSRAPEEEYADNAPIFAMVEETFAVLK
ncbi:MAG: hypothetical protein IT565_12565 [Rhodospirillales bacterium]|nr:hypothetical protein [Rhodospirillales bacterium]